MEGIDIDQFGEHDKIDKHPDKGEMILLNPVGEAKMGSSWELEQETSFGGETHYVRFMK